MEVLELYLPWQWTSRHGTRLGNILPRITQLIPEPLSLKELRIRDLTVTADDISRNVPHLRNLRALTMDRNKDSSGHCWAELRKAGIRLEDVRADEISLPLRDYLESYSSLRCLQVGLLRPFEPTDPSKQPEEFFPRVLVRHRNSLEELSLNMDAPVRPWGDYATNEQFKQALASCLGLRVLKVRITITDEELAENNATSFVGVFFPLLPLLFHSFLVIGAMARHCYACTCITTSSSRFFRLWNRNWYPRAHQVQGPTQACDNHVSGEPYTSFHNSRGS